MSCLFLSLSVDLFSSIGFHVGRSHHVWDDLGIKLGLSNGMRLSPGEKSVRYVQGDKYFIPETNVTLSLYHITRSLNACLPVPNSFDY